MGASSAIWYPPMQGNGLYSLDNDVYRVGLYLAENQTDKYFLWFYKLFGEIALFMDVTKRSNFCLIDLIWIVSNLFLGMVIMEVYPCSGCDYVSFFHYHGKKSFLGSLVDIAKSFIGSSNENDITQRERLLTDIHNHQSSFLAFCHLIGCEYSKVCHKSLIRYAI